MAVGALILAGAPAFADPLPSSTTPLTGSDFQGGDGNQDDAAPYIDWQALQAAGRVVHAPDDNAQDTAFVGGIEDLRPGEWDVTTEPGGVSPGKVNILDAWGAVDQPGTETFLYLGFTREDATGTAAIAFELNRDGRLWDNGHAKIPCRTTGDVLVTTLPHGNDIDIVLVPVEDRVGRRGHGMREDRDDRGDGHDPGRDGPGRGQRGADHEPAAGHLPARLADPDRRVQRSGAEPERPDGGRVRRRSASRSRSIWMHSRSSNEENRKMQDYVTPQPVSVRTCSASGTKFFDLDADGVRDAGEPGIPRFLIWADYDNDGVRDASEPFSVTDNNGHYVIDDIRPPSGSYRLREELATPGAGARPPRGRARSRTRTPPGASRTGRAACSAAAGGRSTAATSPNVTGRDFGNWVPAQPDRREAAVAGRRPGAVRPDRQRR